MYNSNNNSKLWIQCPAGHHSYNNATYKLKHHIFDTESQTALLSQFQVFSNSAIVGHLVKCFFV